MNAADLSMIEILTPGYRVRDLVTNRTTVMHMRQSLAHRIGSGELCCYALDYTVPRLAEVPVVKCHGMTAEDQFDRTVIMDMTKT